MLTDVQLKQFAADGYLKGDVVLNNAEVEELRTELDLVMSGKSAKKPVLNRNMLAGNDDFGMTGMKMEQNEKVIQIVNIWMASEAFLHHAANEKKSVKK